MKRLEYKFKGKVVAMVDIGLNGFAILRITGMGHSRHTESDAKALAETYLVQLKNVTPSPNE